LSPRFVRFAALFYGSLVIVAALWCGLRGFEVRILGESPAASLLLGALTAACTISLGLLAYRLLPVLRGIAEELVVAVRLLAHWLSFGPPLMLAAIPAAALLGLDGATLRTVELGLLAGTPGLAAIGLIIAALTVGMRSGAALSGLLLIPLAVPLLVFGAGALSTAGDAGIALTGAISLLLVAITPFASAAAIRAVRES